MKTQQWMISSDAADVDETWAAVARATAKNELGIAAKVEPRPDPSTQYLPGGVEYQQQQRLICVYTVDFADVADVRRVARRLRELGLVPPRGKPLFYKPGQFQFRSVQANTIHFPFSSGSQSLNLGYTQLHCPKSPPPLLSLGPFVHGMHCLQLVP